ncbi:pyridoxamine 5'-phosphate oxidase [soil metagenome]
MPEDALHRHEDYGQTPLNESDVLADPLEQFGVWLAQAERSDVHEPNAMVVSTVEVDGTPSSRTVLLRTLDEHGFEFFTSYTSQKGRALLADPHVSIVFPWYLIHRQVIVRGVAHPTDPDVSDAYFATRPRGSQIAAAASDQSQPIADRGALERRFEELEREYEGGEVPRPATWGGFRVIPSSIEFWQGRSSRLHDRLRFTRNEKGWSRERLQP